MTGFLATLVERSRGEQDDAVRPRLPSLFEPIEMAPAAEDSDQFVPPAGAAAKTVDTPPPNRPLRERRADSPAVHREPDALSHSDEPSPRTLPRQHAPGFPRVEQNEQRPSPGVERPDPTPQGAAPVTVMSTPPMRGVLPSRDQESVNPIRVGTVERGVRPEWTDQADQADRVNRLDRPGSLERVEPLSDGAAASRKVVVSLLQTEPARPIDRTSPTKGPMVRPHIEGRRSAEIKAPSVKSQLPQMSASPAETVIQVTIGRVEVRAVSAPTTAGRQREVSRVPGLEEYLRGKRSGA